MGLGRVSIVFNNGVGECLHYLFAAGSWTYFHMVVKTYGESTC